MKVGASHWLCVTPAPSRRRVIRGDKPTSRGVCFVLLHSRIDVGLLEVVALEQQRMPGTLRLSVGDAIPKVEAGRMSALAA